MKHLFLIACLCLLSFGARAQIRLSNQLYKIVAKSSNNQRSSASGYKPVQISTSSDGKTLTYQDYYEPAGYSRGLLIDNTGYAPLYTLTYVGTNNGWYIYAQNPNENSGLYVYIKTDGSMMRSHSDTYDASQYFEGTAVSKNNFLGPTR